MERVIRYGTKVTLTALVLLGVLLQTVLVPITAAGLDQTGPVTHGVAVPLTVWAIALILCGQVILLIVWRLTTLTTSDAIFDRRAFALVRAMIAVAGIATLLVLVAFVTLNVLRLTPPLAMVALIGGMALGVAFCLILSTLLGLLRRSASLSSEMAQVV